MQYESFFKQNVKKFKITTGSQAIGCCPLHEDRNPSFSCNCNDGTWFCHGCGEKGNVYQFAEKLGVEAPENENKWCEKMNEVERYTYEDEKGDPLFQVRRYEPKTFRQFHWDGSAWKSGLNGIRRVLYKLPQIINEPIIYVVEGEKDAETLWRWNIPATTCSSGAGKWRDEYSQNLRGKKIVIIPDQDQAGKKHAEQVAQSLWEKVESIKIVTLNKGKDISDWKAQGGTLEEFRSLIVNTPIFTLSPLSNLQKKNCFNLTTLKNLLNEPEVLQDWIVEGLLSIGGVSLLVAKPKTGKSTIARQIALAVAKGDNVFGRKSKSGLVVYLALEERRTDVKNHFRDMGVDGNENIKVHAAPTPEDAINQLKKMVEEESPSFIIIDTMSRLIRMKDVSDYSQATSGLDPILAIARGFNSHVMLLHHSKKGDDKSIDSILGSTGIAGSVDTIILMNRSDKYRTIKTIQRVGEDLPESVIEFDPETRLSKISGSKEEAEIKRFSETITQFLEDQNMPVKQQEIIEAVEGRSQFVRKTLKHMIEDGKVVKEGRGTSGSPYVYSLSSARPTYSGDNGTRDGFGSLTYQDKKEMSRPNIDQHSALVQESLSLFEGRIEKKVEELP
ncbi:MAG: hypothetical protein COX62_05815 [Deltaproteobacteria bacterium CG_4_10_14_0_2_um_filter_43_8]|nr:MAG: hypothetical protein COV43_08340 [Deltaproteobacteria bacterium CG11_big_fil_rev_8_21_14_0_20_42_23]PJA19877.1 MAG: hypothetical protein COX62_05815 [Deltaproteobacteria bacterium CG_4_10_14_0_2_um_filter_43_8]PJC63404.1 MAG: hypothetical protein CO021_09555 [Deltaproteobacteria bacterium CG_4_9_14_0_2_um_filter_42_21]